MSHFMLIDVTSVHEPASSSHTSDCCCWRRRDSLSIMSEVYSRPHHRDTATAVSFRTVLDRVEVAADATSVRDRPIGTIETNRLSASDFGAEQDFEFADDAISLNEDVCAADDDDDDRPNTNSDRTRASNDEKTNRYANLDPESVITVDGKEELPSPEQFHRRVADVGRLKPDGCGRRTTKHAKRNNKTKPNRESNALSDDGDVKACNVAKIQNGSLENVEIKIWARDDINNFNSDDKNRNRLDARDGVRLVSKVRHYCTLPKRKRGTANSKSWYRAALAPPHRVTPDGTDIYYWCDMPKKIIDGELDDGQYNPLWTMRGFTQTFHFWKENKRAQSVPLNAFLTYVTLPWWSIAKDILDHREGPILTF